MEADYRALKKDRWGGWSGYDGWFAGGVNNAQIASVATYEELVPAFRALLAREGGDMGRFYVAVKQLAKLDKSEREAELAALARQPTAGARSRSGRSHASAATCATPIARSAAAYPSGA
jgi:predicted aminopeptidase